jgi:hypothetical protein
MQIAKARLRMKNSQSLAQLFRAGGTLALRCRQHHSHQFTRQSLATCTLLRSIHHHAHVKTPSQKATPLVPV